MPNCLIQPYSANHDYSTTGFSGMLWLKEAPNTAVEYILNRDSLTPAQAIRLWVSAAGFIVFELYDGTTTRTATGTVAVDDITFKCVMFDYSAGTLNVYVNNTLHATATGAALLTLNNAAALLQIGLKVDGTLPLTNGSIALFRMSATIPSADQREAIYRTELPLFQPSAQCCIAGTSSAVTALAYDDSTDILHVGTSWGRSAFKNLLRVESSATVVGAVTTIAASGGTHVIGGTSGKYSQPAMYMRDEIRRNADSKRALGRIPVMQDYDTIGFTATTTNASNSLTAVVVITGTPYLGMGITGTGIPAGTTITAIAGNVYTLSANATASGTTIAMGQNTFDVPRGYTANTPLAFVETARQAQRPGATKDYIVTFNGFYETVVFAVSPGNAAWVRVAMVRAN